MLRGLLLFALLGSANAAVQSLPALPNGAVANAVQVDAAGNLYLAASTASGHVLVTKLAADGTRAIYSTTLAGSTFETPLALALGPDLSIYVTGRTQSADFPTTPGAMQPAQGNANQAFAAKLDPNGALVYATYIGGAELSQGNAIAVDSSGSAYVTGGAFASGFPTTPGSVGGDPGNGRTTGFIVKLNPAGSAALISIIGLGGNQIALDAAGNLFAAGASFGPMQTTSGAFQTSVSQTFCFTSMILSYPCSYQHVAKIDPTGTMLLYGTFLSGSFGAVPTGIAIQSDGSVILAGNTNSPDYPVTPGAYQPQYLYNPAASFLPPTGQTAPTSSGYITKLNAAGTALVWSTFFSGSGAADSITGMQLDPSGNLLLTGVASSSDFPGLWTTPVAARPSPTSPMNFVTRLSPDGVTLSPTQLLAGSGNSALAVRGDGSAVVVPPLDVVSLSNIGRVGAIADIDNTRLVRVAPGQLLTLYGINLAASPDAVSVTFNGIAAPILYAGGQQINLQVPFEIAGQDEITMQVSSPLVSPPLSESFILGTVARQPSLILSSANFTGALFGATCSGIRATQPLAFNADGSLNICTNPAATGSTVTVFLNGLGATSPSLPSGAIAASNLPLTPAPAAGCCGASVVSIDTAAGSIDGIAQVQIQVSSAGSPLVVPLTIQDPGGASYRLRGPVAIWTGK